MNIFSALLCRIILEKRLGLNNFEDLRHSKRKCKKLSHAIALTSEKETATFILLLTLVVCEKNIRILYILYISAKIFPRSCECQQCANHSRNINWHFIGRSFTVPRSLFPYAEVSRTRHGQEARGICRLRTYKEFQRNDKRIAGACESLHRAANGFAEPPESVRSGEKLNSCVPCD